MRITYSEQPRQILFADGFANGPDYTAGILYKNEIICACCGIAFDIFDHYETMAEDFPEIPEDEVILIFEHWVNVAEEIKGDNAINPRDFINNYELEGVHYEN